MGQAESKMELFAFTNWLLGGQATARFHAITNLIFSTPKHVWDVIRGSTPKEAGKEKEGLQAKPAICKATGGFPKCGVFLPLIWGQLLGCAMVRLDVV